MNRGGKNVQGSPSVPLAAVTGSLLLGGSSTFLVNLSAAFARRGDRFPIVSITERNDHVADFERVGNPVCALPDSKLIYEDRLSHAYMELARHQPRALLSCLGTDSFELLRLAPPGVARLGMVQSNDPGPYKTVRTYGRHLDAVVGVSREIAEHLSTFPELAGVRIEHIPYGIDFPEVLPERTFDPGQPLRVIYLGRLLEEQKRVSRLVELVRRTQAAGLPVQFTFVGSGPAEGEMQSQIGAVSGVTFTGQVSNDRAHALLVQQDVMVLLSDYEGLPLSLLEAMGFGVVPLVSDLPSGMREAVPEHCGFRVPVGDVGSALEILRVLCRERGRLRMLSGNSANLAREEYSADRMAERYLSLVSVLSQAPGRWPEKVKIPTPYGLRPWIYGGVLRKMRRALKPLGAALRQYR